MRLIAKCEDNVINIRVDALEIREGDTAFAFRKASNALTATEFVGMFDLGSMDYLYLSEERER